MEEFEKGNTRKFKDLPFVIAIIAPFLTIGVGYFGTTAANIYLVSLALFSLLWIYGKKSGKEKRISGILLGGVALALIGQLSMIVALGFAIVGLNHDLIRSRAEQAELEKFYK